MFCFWITVPYMSLWIFIYDYILAHDTSCGCIKMKSMLAPSEGNIGLLLPEKQIISYLTVRLEVTLHGKCLIFSPFLLPCVKQSCSCRYIDYGRMKLPNWPEAISFSSQEKFWTSRSFCLQVSLFKSSCITCMEVRAELRLCFLLLGYGLLF